jgi:DNA polymerase I-like protein with 3'-5' exonuclease and polymerase domains
LNLLDNKYERKDVKIMFFGWLYNDKKHDIFDKIYNKQQILDKYFNKRFVTNPYGRKLECDKFHALNYLIQSTSADTFYNSILKIDQYLQDNKLKSNIVCMMHDSVLMDMKDEEMSHLKKIKKIYSDTLYGKIRVNTKRLDLTIGTWKHYDKINYSRRKENKYSSNI